eukprot:COSAG06_NODE_9132_length_1978_cov_2.985631_2_plen_44_part_00
MDKREANGSASQRQIDSDRSGGGAAVSIDQSNEVIHSTSYFEW